LSDQSSCDKPRIAVLGLGHVGLPTALGFVEMGWEVIGADGAPKQWDNAHY
jgi:UDP-N-acetyl-D-mannosaminuronate dehydrogenase